MISIVRTTGVDADFVELVNELDKELAVRDGADHAFFAKINKAAQLDYAVVAYWHGKPAGSGAFRPYANDSAEIKRMYVRTEFRKNGIATSILNQLLLWCKECEFKTVILETGMNQPEAIQLYQKNGFARIPNYGQYVGVDLSVCFEKSLDARLTTAGASL